MIFKIITARERKMWEEWLNESHFYARTMRFCDLNQKGFSYKDIKSDVKINLKAHELKIIERFLKNAYKNTTGSQLETLFTVIRKRGSWNSPKTTFTINIDAYFKYIDYINVRMSRDINIKMYTYSTISSTVNFCTGMFISAALVLISIFVSIMLARGENFNELDTFLTRFNQREITLEKIDFQIQSSSSKLEKNFRELINKQTMKKGGS